VADLVREAPASAGALVVLWVVAVADKGAFGRAAALGVGAAALVVLVMSLAARRSCSGSIATSTSRSPGTVDLEGRVDLGEVWLRREPPVGVLRWQT